jgi:hypothetical protein
MTLLLCSLALASEASAAGWVKAPGEGGIGNSNAVLRSAGPHRLPGHLGRRPTVLGAGPELFHKPDVATRPAVTDARAQFGPSPSFEEVQASCLGSAISL